MNELLVLLLNCGGPAFVAAILFVSLRRHIRRHDEELQKMESTLYKLGLDTPAPAPRTTPPPAPLPRARVNVPFVTQLWVRWLPVSIAVLGLSFLTWTIVMITQVGRYHDSLSEMRTRLKTLETHCLEKQ